MTTQTCPTCGKKFQVSSQRAHSLEEKGYKSYCLDCIREESIETVNFD